MKILRSLPVVSAALVLGLGVFSRGLNAAQSPTAAPTIAGTNAAPQEPETPQAVFDVTSSPVKDPFFPHTTRLPMTASVTNAPVLVDASIFTLKGLSGPVGHRLALINNRTLAVGETTEITVADGRKIKVHCLDVKENSAIIRADNQGSPIELRYEEHFLKR